MSQNGPKNKPGEDQFFQIDPKGEIKPAAGDETPKPLEPFGQWNVDATPVEWNAEPQPSEEPAPLWQMDPANESKEPSIILESPDAAPHPSETTQPGISMPSLSPTDDNELPFHSQHDIETLHSPIGQTESEHIVDEQPIEPPVAVEHDTSGLTPVPQVILEEWQEADLRSFSPPETVESQPASEPQPEPEPNLEPEAEHEPALQPEPALEETPKEDLSYRLRSQIDLLQRQVNTIHGLGPEKKLNDGQIEIFRKYIALKEAESRDLIDQKRQYQAFLQKLDAQLKGFAKKNQQLVVELDTSKAREEQTRKDLLNLKEKYREDLQRTKAEYEQKILQSGKASSAAEDFDRKREEWKGKIREELKRIRLKEKELENKYELLKRDTQALLDSKDQHVLELKRKSDALELEMDQLEEKLRQSNVLFSQMDSKKRRLVETLRLVMALLEQLDKPDQGSGGNSSESA